MSSLVASARRRVAQLIVVSAALLASAPTAGAQWNVSRFDTSPHRVSLTVGIDPAVITTLGYSYVLGARGHLVQLGVDGGIVAGTRNADDFRVRVHAETSILQRNSMRVTGRAAFVTRGTKNTIYDAVGFGADLGGTAGVYRRRWFAAGEIGLDKPIVTHVKQSEWYRTWFYPGAKDGWYLDTGGTWRFGAIGGVTIGKNELMVRAGIPRTERGNAITVPGYASIGLGRTF